jgi:hypothetical protein
MSSGASKMKTLFKSHGVWDLVEKGAPNPDHNSQENQKKRCTSIVHHPTSST